MRSPGINGEGELRGQLANPSSLAKWLLNGLCVLLCVCARPYTIYFVLPWHDIAYLCWKCRETPTSQPLSTIQTYIYTHIRSSRLPHPNTALIIIIIISVLVDSQAVGYCIIAYYNAVANGLAVYQYSLGRIDRPALSVIIIMLFSCHEWPMIFLHPLTPSNTLPLVGPHPQTS